ncbi:MAG: hypothetical protein U1E76_15635 [Planctomycetota bacterium]
MRRCLIQGLVVCTFLGCQSTARRADVQAASPDKAPAAAEPARPDDDKLLELAARRAQLERQLPLDQKKLARAELELSSLAAVSRVAAEKARAELEMATAALKLFDESEAPIKSARARLEVQQSEDNLADQREEMQQLEMMYKEDDLADKTKEIVLRRGQRRLERATQQLELQKAETDKLLNRDLAESRRKLQLAIAEKEAEVARQERAMQGEQMDKEMAVMSAQADLARDQEELARVSEKLASARPQP